MNYALEAIDLTKRFSDAVAVNNVNLTVGEGEFFSFLGPSGCGKTTLLRMVAGFEKPTSGQLLVKGQSVVDVPPHKRPVNMVFQSYALFPHMTVLQNIAFGLQQSQAAPKSDIERLAKEALSMVRLEHLGDRYPSQLSGGQQQRVAVARALVKRPFILLLDEPLSALDPQIREEMQSELARLQKELGLTFIMVTHDQTEALALSTKIAVFLLGNLEQVGTPQEIYNEPRTRFVADFIGQSNMLQGRILRRSNGYAEVELARSGAESDNCALTIHVRDNQSSHARDGDAVTVWMKPSSFRISRTAGDADSRSSRLPSVISEKVFQGATTLYTLRLPNGESVRAVIANQFAESDESDFVVGDAVVLRVKQDDCSYVDQANQSAALVDAQKV